MLQFGGTVQTELTTSRTWEKEREKLIIVSGHMKEYVLTSSFSRSSELNATILRDCSNRTHHIADVGEREGKVNYFLWSHEGVFFCTVFSHLSYLSGTIWRDLSYLRTAPHMCSGEWRRRKSYQVIKIDFAKLPTLSS